MKNVNRYNADKFLNESEMVALYALTDLFVRQRCYGEYSGDTPWYKLSLNAWVFIGDSDGLIKYGFVKPVSDTRSISGSFIRVSPTDLMYYEFIYPEIADTEPGDNWMRVLVVDSKGVKNAAD